MQILNAKKFFDLIENDPELGRLLVDHFNSLPAADALVGGGAPTATARLQHYLESEGVYWYDGGTLPLMPDEIPPVGTQSEGEGEVE